MMDKWKKWLAALLATAMLLSLAPAMALADERVEIPAGDEGLTVDWSETPAVDEAPVSANTGAGSKAEDQAQAMSLLPLEEVKLNLDLSAAGLFRSELDAVPVSTLLKLTGEYGKSIEAQEGDVILWAKADGSASASKMPDAFTQVGLDGTMDLTPTRSNYNSLTLHLIVGKPDQLLTTNTRYVVSLQLPSEARNDMLSTVEMYLLPKEGEESAVRTPVNIVHSSSGESWTYVNNERTDCYYNYVSVREGELKKDHDVAVKLVLNAPYDTLTPQAYYGFFSTQEELDEAVAAAGKDPSAQLRPGADITDQLFPTGSIAVEGGFTLRAKDHWVDEFTLVLKRGDKIVWMMPVQMDINSMGDYIDISSGVYDPENPTVRVGYHSGYDDVEVGNGYYDVTVFRMNRKKANEECLIRAVYTHEGEYDVDYTPYVEKVVASTEKFYDDFKDVEDLPDIKEDFFGDGYKADYSKGVYFSVFSKEEGNPRLAVEAAKVYGPSMSTETGRIFTQEGTAAEYNDSLSFGKTRMFKMLNEETPATGKYSYRAEICFNYNSASTSENLKLADYVEKAVAGTRYYDSLSDAAGQTDIKDKLFYIGSSSEAAGYEADFSGGVHFTIFWYDGTVTKFIVKTTPFVAPEIVPP